MAKPAARAAKINMPHGDSIGIATCWGERRKPLVEGGPGRSSIGAAKDSRGPRRGGPGGRSAVAARVEKSGRSRVNYQSLDDCERRTHRGVDALSNESAAVVGRVDVCGLSRIDG